MNQYHRCWPYPGESCALCDADPPMTWRDWQRVAGYAVLFGAFFVLVFGFVWILGGAL